jgi:ribosome-associated toxin RatA of RatAB toxin-antitoxin module
MADQASSSITVAANKAAIMGVIADFPAYPEWAGYVKKAEVVAEGPDGRAQQVHFVLDAGVIKDDYILEYVWDNDTEVSWHLVKGGVLKGMDGTYALADAGEGQTKVDYRLAVDLKIPMIGLIRRKAEKVIIDTALKELKKRVER